VKGVAEIGDRLPPEIVDGRHAGVPVARAREPSFEIQIVVMAGAQRSCGPPSTAPRRREWDSRRVTLSAPFGLLSSAFIDSHEGTRIPLSQLARSSRRLAPAPFVESQARASQSLITAIALALFAVLLLLYLALDSFTEAAVILVTIPVAFVGGIVGLLIAGDTWKHAHPERCRKKSSPFSRRAGADRRVRRYRARRRVDQAVRPGQ